MCVVDGDPAKFYSEHHPRARKPHRCYDCDRTITPGERYRRVSGKWDLTVSSYVHCLDCAALSDAVNDVECSWLFGSLLDDALTAIAPDSEHWSAPPEKMGRLIGLVFKARDPFLARAA